MSSKLTRFLVSSSAIALLLISVDANAQINKDDAKCRKTVHKVVSKYVDSALKTFDKCTKNAVKAGQKGEAIPDCSTLAAADEKNKLPKVIQKLQESLDGDKAKCDEITHALALAEHELCGPPIGSDIPVTGTDWTEVADCLVALVEENITRMYSAMLSPDFAAAGTTADDPKGVGKCIQTVSKNAVKLHKTIMKEQGKAQQNCDKKGESGGLEACAPLGNYDYTMGTSDPKGKILKTIVKMKESIDKACFELSAKDQALVGACGNELTNAQNCITDKVLSSASGLSASAFDQPGTCPGQVRVTVRAGATGGIPDLRPTELDVGWKGLGHNAQVIDGFVGRVNVDCGASTNNECESCTVSAACAENNCRCDGDIATICDEPFGPDADDCGGGQCVVYFGPPLALVASGTPTCVVNTISEDIVGTANLETGETESSVATNSKVHSGISIVQPCPTCEGELSLCVGGDRNNLPCQVDAVHPTFGPVSYDCPPDPIANVSGAGLQIELELTDGSTSLPFNAPCTDLGFGAFDCACAVCSGDEAIPCNDDQTCIDAGAGTCTVTGANGAASRPNFCENNLTCNDIGGGEGECAAGNPTDMYCDGFLRGSGAGVITCAPGDTTPADGQDDDCAALNASCAGGNCGNCTLTETRRCYLDPIEATGQAGTEQGVLVSTFCTPPTNSSAINGAAGTPGAGRVKLDFSFTGYCPDGLTQWGPGGANCQVAP